MIILPVPQPVDYGVSAAGSSTSFYGVIAVASVILGLAGLSYGWRMIRRCMDRDSSQAETSVGVPSKNSVGG